MNFLRALAIGALCVGTSTAVAIRGAPVSGDESALLKVDDAAIGFHPVKLNETLLDPNFTWTDSSGNTRNKSGILRALRSGKKLFMEIGSSNGGEATIAPITRKAHDYGQVGVVQENSGEVYTLRVWVKRAGDWELLIYHAVSSGASPSADAGKEECKNPCNTVPFRPQTRDEREVIGAYQAVERAVSAHDSAAWAAHIAAEFFAVTSNSDQPLDKSTRMAGLDNQKVGGIAPFPLVSARMFQFGDAMVMTSQQQPEHGLPLHVTRVWFKRKGRWLEAYSYQTTIHAASSAR